MMKIVLASAIVSSVIATAIGQIVPPPTAGQTTTPTNQGVVTNATGAPRGGSTTSPISSIPTNATARPTLPVTDTNSAPVFINVMPALVTDTNGLALGTLVQLSLTRSGMVNFGLVDVGGQLVSMPWLLIVSGLSTHVGTNIQNVLNGPPPVLMGPGSFPPQQDLQNQILSDVADQITAPRVVNRSTAQGRSGGAGVTLTGGDTNVLSFNTNFAAPTNTARSTNYTAGNSVTNTTNGVPSPIGSTNAPYNRYESGTGQNTNHPPLPNHLQP